MKTCNYKEITCESGIWILLILLIAGFLTFCTSITANGQQYNAKVKRVIDGDTLNVTLLSETIKVRLWGIDTPEYSQAYSNAAKKFTARLVHNRSVTLELKDWDDYGRMVAIVTLPDGRSLNEELLKNGFAWVHIYYCKEAICNTWYSYEKKARKKRLGLWKDRSPVPPWKWKRYNKNK